MVLDRDGPAWAFSSLQLFTCMITRSNPPTAANPAMLSGLHDERPKRRVADRHC